METVLIQNKVVTMHYDLVQTYEAGIELEGHEVKSLKNKRGSLMGAYVTFKNGEAFLINAEIPPYQAKNVPLSYNPQRPRRLLLHKKEISSLTGRKKEKGLTIIPICIYNKGRHIKLKIAVARGKSKKDKRDRLKKRAVERDLARTLKRNINL